MSNPFHNLLSLPSSVDARVAFALAGELLTARTVEQVTEVLCAGVSRVVTTIEECRLAWVARELCEARGGGDNARDDETIRFELVAVDHLVSKFESEADAKLCDRQPVLLATSVHERHDAQLRVLNQSLNRPPLQIPAQSSPHHTHQPSAYQAAVQALRGATGQVRVRGRVQTFVAVCVEGRASGVLILESAGEFNADELQAVETLARLGGWAVENVRRIADAERLSQTDDLTNLRNARYLRDYLLSEIRRAERYGASVALLFLDLDNFKSVNDEHGHLVGSHVLIEVAAAITASVRDTDTVARYGGDEFVVVLPETDTHRALQVAERVRDSLARTTFAGGRGLQLTLTASFGVASYPSNAQSAQQLLETADQAMYEAKSARKNCVRPAHARRFDYFDEKFCA